MGKKQHKNYLCKRAIKFNFEEEVISGDIYTDNEKEFFLKK